VPREIVKQSRINQYVSGEIGLRGKCRPGLWSSVAGATQRMEGVPIYQPRVFPRRAIEVFADFVRVRAHAGLPDAAYYRTELPPYLGAFHACPAMNKTVCSRTRQKTARGKPDSSRKAGLKVAGKLQAGRSFDTRRLT
jgi:hypothetical protein